MKDKKENSKNYITAKLAFFDYGWAEKVIYRIKAKTTEKYKGFLMIDKIKDFFGITNKEIKGFEKKEIKDETKRIEWTRDEEGKIVSPYRSKKLNI